MERRAEGFDLREDYHLEGMGNGKGTNSIICRESYFQMATVLSNHNSLCSSDQIYAELGGDND